MFAYLNPYRNAGKLDPTKPVDTFGLIRGPKPIAPHRCHPPGRFLRFLYKIVGCPVRVGSVYRCKCRTIFKLNKAYRSVSCAWDRADRRDWLDLGGEVADEPEDDEPEDDE